MSKPSLAYVTRSLLITGGLCLFLLNPLSAQLRVKQVKSPNDIAGKNGIIYSLPRTVLVVDLWYTRTDDIPGPYAEFAGELLGDDEVIRTAKVSHTLDDACITAYVEPDPGQLYMVETEEKNEQSVLIEFSSNGLLVGSGLLGAKEKTALSRTERPTGGALDMQEIFPAYKKAIMKEVIDTITRVVTFDTLTYTEKILKRLLIEQTEREKAAEASALIHDIGQDQYALLVGYQETAYSYEAIRYMYDQLESQRSSYLKLFTGVTRSEKLHARYYIVPDPGAMESPYRIAGFDSQQGLVGPGAGDDIFLTIEGSGVSALVGNFLPSTTGPSGYFYRIPENCLVTILFDGSALAQETIVVNQAGVVRNLPPRITEVEFDGLTGGLKRVIYK